MAICYNCGIKFYGKTCGRCGWLAKYTCWFCKRDISPILDKMCKECKWFICSSCDNCGCQDARPLSNEEKRREPLRVENKWQN